MKKLLTYLLVLAIAFFGGYFVFNEFLKTPNAEMPNAMTEATDMPAEEPVIESGPSEDVQGATEAAEMGTETAPETAEPPRTVNSPMGAIDLDIEVTEPEDSADIENSVAADQIGGVYDVDDKWQEFSKPEIGMMFHFPKGWIITDDGEQIEIKSHDSDYDKFNQPEGYKIFYIVYNISEDDMSYHESQLEDLVNKNRQYSSVDVSVYEKTGADIKAFSYFDNDCGKGMKAYWSYEGKLYYAFRGASCGQQITDEETEIFEKILSSMLLF